MFVDTLIEGKTLVKALIDTSSKFNTIEGMSIPLIDEDFNKASTTKNNSPVFDLLLEELTNMFKNLSFKISKNKKYPKVDSKSYCSTIDLGDRYKKLSLKMYLNNIW
ncbi:8753_t:CDS:2, partial [Diversispora eburnea]